MLAWIGAHLPDAVIMVGALVIGLTCFVAIRQLARIRRLAKTPPPGWTRDEMGIAVKLVDEGFTPNEASTAIRDTRRRR